jgi:carboxypeptidase PM20D1
MVRTTLAVNMLKASEKRNVIPPEAVAEIDCRMLAGDEPEEIVAWIRRVIDDAHVDVEMVNAPKRPNLSPPDTELYKALARALEAHRPGVVVAPQIMTAFTDNWTFRACGLAAYGWSPLLMGEEELGRVHGNDERVAVDDLRDGVRTYTEMLLDVAAA